MFKHLFSSLPVAFVMLAFAVAPVLAEDDVSPAPPTQRWVPMVIALLLSLAIGAASFWSARRNQLN